MKVDTTESYLCDICPAFKRYRFRNILDAVRMVTIQPEIDPDPIHVCRKCLTNMLSMLKKGKGRRRK